MGRAQVWSLRTPSLRSLHWFFTHISRCCYSKMLDVHFVSQDNQKLQYKQIIKIVLLMKLCLKFRFKLLNCYLPINLIAHEPQGPGLGTPWYFMIDCRLDLKGLISNISLSSTNHISDHYNENQASQRSANNDWD